MKEIPALSQLFNAAGAFLIAFVATQASLSLMAPSPPRSIQVEARAPIRIERSWLSSQEISPPAIEVEASQPRRKRIPKVRWEVRSETRKKEPAPQPVPEFLPELRPEAPPIFGVRSRQLGFTQLVKVFGEDCDHFELVPRHQRPGRTTIHTRVRGPGEPFQPEFFLPPGRR